MAWFKCGGGNKVYNLGTGTSFNIQTLLPGIDYTKLTVANFVRCLGATAINSTGAWADVGYGSSASAADVDIRSQLVSSAMSYNASTGVLTVPSLTAYASCRPNVNGAATDNKSGSTATYTVYLIDGDIETV